MIEQGIIELHGQPLITGELFIWAEDEMGRSISPERLKSYLFAWDRRSFYGTFIETIHKDNTFGLLLSPLTAAHFLADPQPSHFTTIRWSRELLNVQQVARLCLEALTQGWFVPSFEAWLAGRIGWKLRLPEAHQVQIPHMNEWFEHVLQDMMAQEGEVAETFEILLHEQQLLRQRFEHEPVSAYHWLDEEQWLVAIGWKRDEVPFRVSIQLKEPTTEETAWTLCLLLQDRDMPDRIVETNFTGRPQTGQFPDHWQDFVEQRTVQEVEKLSCLVPWLAGLDRNDDGSVELDDEQVWDFLQDDSAELIKAGCSVLLPSWWEEIRLRKPRLKAKIKSSVGANHDSLFGINQIIQFDWKVAIGDLELSEEEFDRLLTEKKRLMLIRGNWVQLDQEFLDQVMKQVARAKKQSGLPLRDVLEMYWLGSNDAEQPASRQQEHALVDEMSEMKIEVELNSHLQKLVNQLQFTTTLPMATPPRELQADLRQYQLAGVSWLMFLRKYGLGGCLADDMGLGKTIQFIAYLLCSKQESTQGPALLVCPTSVMGNWQKELQRFAPSLRVYVHYGSTRDKGEAFLEQVAATDLVITSYTLAHLDQEDLAQVKWGVICLDEAQNIKNVHTKQRAAIRQLDAWHRIALTGTPIENRLTELWSIFDFLNPGYLGSLSTFTKTYVNTIEKKHDPILIAQVQKLIRPFLLRRVKKDPAIQLDLPEKNEMKTFVSLTAEQGALYENVVQDMFEKLETLTGMEKRGLILGALTKLKQICDHPLLYVKEGGSTSLEASSNKLARLLEMVEELRAEGDKCLIFTQYVEMGHLLQKMFEQTLGESALFLHGGVPKSKRDRLVARFQESAESRDEPCGIFILSLKAGGTGLNLTAANHVFHFDRWWNPAVEDQATDRAFRIGQTRDVQVHKFVTLGTLEERIDEMIERKQGLSQQIVGGGEQWITEMSTQELKEMFVLRKEWVGK